MHKKAPSESGMFSPRVFLAFLLCSAGILLAISSFTGKPGRERHSPSNHLERYLPVPGGEADDLDRLEAEWNNRLTYPTGIFDPGWVRQAAAVDKLIARNVPFG